MKSKHEKRPTDLGSPRRMNRTGITASPKDAAMQKKNADELPITPGDPAAVHALCAEYEASVGPLGTMPPPTTMKGMAKTAMTALKGERATVLIDKLGERLAFERTGTRLYEGLLAKHEQSGGFDGGPSTEELARLLDEELQHMHLVHEAMEQLGADPTAMTPAANVTAVLSQGIPKVILDPRSTFVEAVHAIHVAELTDNDGWQMLIDLCDEMGQDDMATRFRVALAEEDEHLALVRRWLAAYTTAAANRQEPEERPAATT